MSPEVFFSFSGDLFDAMLDQWVQRNKIGVATGGVLYAEKVNRTLDFDVYVTSV